MPRTLTLAVAAGVLLLLLVGAATAGTPSPPQAIVREVTAVTFFAFPPGQFSSDSILTWRLSAEDPDQINGTFTYTVYVNQTDAPDGWLRVNASHLPLAGRPGWVYTTKTDTGPFFGVNQTPPQGGIVDYTINMTAWNGTSESAKSCLVTVRATVVGSHDQCGAPVIRPPNGANALVNVTSNQTRGGNIDIRWGLSPDDPNNQTGNFTYEVYQSTSVNGAATPFTSVGVDPVTGADANGVRYFNQAHSSGTASFVASFKIIAKDPLTRQWANFSCVATVNSQNLYESNGCGSLSTLPAPSIAGGPQFPLLDVAAFATQTGLSLDLVGWLLSGVFLLCVTISGFRVAEGAGALIGASLGFVAVVIMGLMPLWITVVVFMAAVTVLVFTMRGGGE